MSRHGDDAWNCAADGPDASDIDGDEPIGSERRGLDMAEAIANGEACEGCGAYPAVCECGEPRDTIETPAPICVCCKVERATTLDKCRDCDVGMCGCNDESTIADIETQIERLHFFMTVSPFAKDPS